MTFNDATLQEATLRRWDREIKGKTPCQGNKKTCINIMLMQVSSCSPMRSDVALFPDTEAGENAPQQVIRGKLAGDFAQRLLREPQLFRQQLAGPGAKQLRFALL